MDAIFSVDSLSPDVLVIGQSTDMSVNSTVHFIDYTMTPNNLVQSAITVNLQVTLVIPFDYCTPDLVVPAINDLQIQMGKNVTTFVDLANISNGDCRYVVELND